MASKCLLLFVLFFVTNVYANCNFETNSFSCDECTRCGGYWCNNLQELSHCSATLTDDWCPGEVEKLPRVPTVDIEGPSLSPSYAERTIYPGKLNNIISINYVLKDHLSIKTALNHSPKVYFTIVNSTQITDIGLKKETIGSCKGSLCSVTVEPKPSAEFCSYNSSTTEVVYVKVKIEGLEEEALIKYHVPCACECSKRIERKSPRCHWNGDLSCGQCTCYEGWTGPFCNEAVCEKKRGDLACNNPAIEGECSGNGYCGPCDRCVCRAQGEGWQYLDAAQYCAGLCTLAADCDHCLRNGSLGQCDDCDRAMAIQQYNATAADQLDEYGRRIWVHCNETIDDCYIEYVTMRDDDNEMYVMIVKHCNQIEGAAGYAAATKVPIIVGVLAMLAAAAGAGAFVVWKHASAAAPLPLADPHYQNIDAEDCIGENPLYKPPTSSFKNPTYGKW